MPHIQASCKQVKDSSQPCMVTHYRYHNIYFRKKGKPMRIMALPFIEANLYFHVRRAHLHVML